jgi:hypothetical protein
MKTRTLRKQRADKYHEMVLVAVTELKLDTEVTLGEKNQTTKQKRTRGSQEESW